MKTRLGLFGLIFVNMVFSAFGSEPFDSRMAEKAALYVSECNGPGVEPKPKMKEFEKYLSENGLKDAKLECGVSNFGTTSPVILIHAVGGSEYYVNFVRSGKKGWKTGEVILDAMTAEGKKRKVVWPIQSPSKKQKE
jgi:hypothetical protein